MIPTSTVAAIMMAIIRISHVFQVIHLCAAMAVSLQSARMELQPRRNIEIKARCENLVESRRAAEQFGARFSGVLEQIDTYFQVPHGRLKLRQIMDHGTELIWYRRDNHAAARMSE